MGTEVDALVDGELGRYTSMLSTQDKLLVLDLAKRLASDRPIGDGLPRWVSMTKAAEVANVSRRAIRQAIDAGALKAVTPRGLERTRRIRTSDLLAWMEGK